MRRIFSLAVLVAAAATLLVAPAAGAKVRLAGGATTLKLATGTAQALADNGVSVTPLNPAKVRRGAVAFPITGGSIDPANARGRIDHSGGLALRAGGTRVALRSFRVHVGAKRAILTARAGGDRLTVLSLSLARAKVTRNGLGTTVRGVRAVLSGQAARALNAAFDTSVFAKGLPIGRVAVRAVPAQVQFVGGATTLALDQGAAQALQSLNIQAAPIDPASAGGAGLSFPITGGKANAETFAGSIRHSGGIRLSRGDTVVDLTAFTIKVDSSPDLTARVGDGRVSILDLDLSQLEASVRGRRVQLSGVRATLTATAAQALNQAFSTDAFKEGLLIGTASVAARAR
jgi:Htaa